MNDTLDQMNTSVLTELSRLSDTYFDTLVATIQNAYSLITPQTEEDTTPATAPTVIATEHVVIQPSAEPKTSKGRKQTFSEQYEKWALFNAHVTILKESVKINSLSKTKQFLQNLQSYTHQHSVQISSFLSAG